MLNTILSVLITIVVGFFAFATFRMANNKDK